MPNRLLLQELLSKQVELIKDGDARHAKCLTQVDNFVQILKDNQVCTICQAKEQNYDQEKRPNCWVKKGQILILISKVDYLSQ